MIVKKVENPKKSVSKAARIIRLTNYVREPELENKAAKCIYHGARNFITDEPKSQTAEMVALAQEAVRSDDPINHYVLSWKEHEKPSKKQVEEMVTIFLDELGITGHQIIYGLHADTDNLHLHIVVNRVHQETFKCVEINRGFDIEAAHRAVARIEQAQGWEPEQNALFTVKDGELVKRSQDPDKPKQPDQTKCEKELRTGEKSAQRIAIEEANPIIKAAKSWEQLHRDLAAKGMRYEKTGSGATVFVGEVGVKASSVNREASLGKLQKRLGPYQAPSRPYQVEERKPEPLRNNQPGWEEYITARKAHYKAKVAEKIELDKKQEKERLEQLERHRVKRNELLKGNWKGRGEALNALRSVIAADHAVVKAALKDKQKRDREKFRQRFKSFPDYQRWEFSEEPQELQGDVYVLPKPMDIRSLAYEVVGRHVYYFRPETPKVVEFVDKGDRIVAHNWRDPNSCLAGLQLAAQKWKEIYVYGCDEFKAMTVKLAAEHGFKIMNPELQEEIQKERERIKWRKEDRGKRIKEEPEMGGPTM
jgi:hypothetical protein